MATLTTYPKYHTPHMYSISVTLTQAPAILTSVATVLSTVLLFSFTTLFQLGRLVTIYLFVPMLQSMGHVSRHAWKKTEKFRDDIFYHFMIWILNPYAMALFIFWPGWLIIGAVWLLLRW